MGALKVFCSRALLACAVAALGFAPASAQNGVQNGVQTGAQNSVQTGAAGSTTIIEPPPPLLPLTSALEHPGQDSNIPPDSDQISAYLREDGLGRRDVRVLSGPGRGWVIAYVFGDATGAYSAFTSFAEGGRPTGDVVASGKPGHEAVRTPDGDVVLLSGVSVVRLHSPARAETLKPIMRAIDVQLPKVGGRRGQAPLLPTLLPPDGLEKASIRYSLGPQSYAAMGGVLPASSVDWDKSTEAVTAHYAGGGVLTLLLYPTPQIAGNSGRAVEETVNRIGPGHFGTVKLRRLGPLVGMTSGSFTSDRAQSLLDSLKLNQIVSFDEKMPLEFHTEVRKTASLLENIAVLTGVLVLAAVLLGLFLGGARAGIRVLQGKPAATEPEFLTINLREQPEALFVPGDATRHGPRS